MDYSPLEERWNVITHGIGILLSVVGLLLLMLKASVQQDELYYLAFGIYGLSLIVLYSASTSYHSAKVESKRKHLKVFDHAAIYVLIAGTSTPIILISLQKTQHQLLLLFIMWGVALVGIVFKLFFTGRFKLVSTLGYIAQGCIMIFVLYPVWDTLPHEMISLILWGGVSYIVGAVLYMIKQVRFNHVIFHFFVLLGSLLHYFAIYWYV